MMDQGLVDQFIEAGESVLAEMRSLTPQEADLKGADGGWSPRFVVHHLADAEIVNARRLRRLLSEDNVTLDTFDPVALAQGTHYDRPVEESIALFEATQRANVGLIESLTPADWEKRGTHVELGVYTVSVWLSRRTEHNAGHLKQIEDARGSREGS